MKAYLSHVMTKATSSDKLFIAAVQARLADAGIEIWDPADHERGLFTMEQFQDKDWKGMKGCDLVVFAWSLNAPASRGMNAEIEWAARIFKLPCLVVLDLGTDIEPWPQQSVMSAPVWSFSHLNNSFTEILKCLCQRMRQVAKPSRSSRVSSGTSRTPSPRSPGSRRSGTTNTTRASRSTGTSPNRRTKRTPS